MRFELTNNQRLYLGLEPIDASWERVALKGDPYREESILYFDGDTIKRYITSTAHQYKECQYDELTRSRNVLLPKTGKGKEKKLTASVLESRQPVGVYCIIEAHSRILIANFNTQTTFYDSRWEQLTLAEAKPFDETIGEFISTVPTGFLGEIDRFKNVKRRNAKFKPGDFFSFRISLAEYGFGRILLDVDQLKKRSLVPEGHGLEFLMAKPVLVKIYAYTSQNKKVDLLELSDSSSLPSSYMMDNLLLYGQFEVIGNKKLKAEDLDLPMSYGRHLAADKFSVFLQWGLIHVELSTSKFNKYTVADNPFAPKKVVSSKVTNPYGKYAIGFYPHHYDAFEIKEAIRNNGNYHFNSVPNYRDHFDLRNPQNNDIKEEIMDALGLDPQKGYDDNCLLTNTMSTTELLTLLNQ